MISINMQKAKLIAHDKRRAARAEEFAPYDEIISKQIPNNDLTQAETKRQEIRDKYAALQTQIDAAMNVDELKQIIDGMN